MEKQEAVERVVGTHAINSKEIIQAVEDRAEKLTAAAWDSSLPFSNLTVWKAVMAVLMKAVKSFPGSILIQFGKYSGEKQTNKPFWL